MKFTLSWLKEHLETDAPLDTIAERLTMLGLEIDGIGNRAAGMEGFTVGHVLEARPHPDADRLQVCIVDTGDGTSEVVCGAPNARAGMKGVFAGPGSYVPGIDLKLKKTKIRGVESNGMLLSEREMSLSDEHEGIIELPDDAPIGASAVAVMGLDDPVIDVAITPNRGDCLGVRGIARDLAAAGLGTLKPLDTSPVAGAFQSPIAVSLDFDDATRDACPYFVGRMVRGVKNGDSPGWLQDRLVAVGLRPISALVDITNLLTLGLNRPLHAFDADKVRGNLHVRLATGDDRLMALNDKEYELDDAMVVIADDDEVEALGGVMGGLRTGCTGDTVNVFLESAYFDPVRTAATGRKLNLQSDARFRFERGIDPAFLVDGMEIGTRLVLELCGGEASELIIVGGEPDWKRDIVLRDGRVRDLGGVDVGKGEAERILNTLGFETTATDGGLTTAVPPWRGDIVGEADLVEEVVRVYGYDRVEAVPLERTDALPRPSLSPVQRRRATTRRVLAGRGLVEAVTYSFMPSNQAALFGGDHVRLINPISSDLDVMRPSILPNLIAAAGRNANRGIVDAALFEVGPQYSGTRPEDQAMVAAGVRSGRAVPRDWAQATRDVDAFDAKADALAVLGGLGVSVDNLQVIAEAPDWYHPGRAGSLRLGPQTVLAHFGEIHPGVLRRMDVKGPIAGFEVLLDALPKPKARKGAARPHLDLSSLQPVARDFAFVVDRDVAADAVVRAARGADKKLIVDVRVFDVFTDDALGGDKKSLAVSVVLQPTDKTLTDDDIEAVADKVVASVEKATGGSLRT
jgi:phenylalanyl-tRNA synthetase beta chain